MRVVVRALSILSLVAQSPRGSTLSDIAERLDLPLATAHRLVATLVAENFVTRSPTNRRYFLGPAAGRLGQVGVRPQESSLIEAHPALKAASKQSGETVFLSELVHDQVTCLALCNSAHPLRLFVHIGQVMPLNAAASARVLLAWLDVSVAQKILGPGPYLAFTAETPRTQAEVLDRLKLVRERGYDLCDSELDENVWAVAAPVHSSVGEVIASVTIAVPSSRVAVASEREALIELALSSAAAMSADLGWEPSSGYEMDDL